MSSGNSNFIVDNIGAREKDRAQRKRREISSMRITIVGERS